MGTGDEGRPEAGTTRLREIVGEVTDAHGYDLEDLTIRSMGRRRVVRVVIDADDGVSLDDAAEVSRAISERLDGIGTDDPMGEAPYTLEVTSPGIGRPLREPRHYRRSGGRLLIVETTDGGPVTGHLLRAGDTGIELVVPGPDAKPGKGGVRVVEIPYSTITRAKVEVEFGAPAAAVQELLDAEGVSR